MSNECKDRNRNSKLVKILPLYCLEMSFKAVDGIFCEFTGVTKLHGMLGEQQEKMMVASLVISQVNSLLRQLKVEENVIYCSKQPSCSSFYLGSIIHQKHNPGGWYHFYKRLISVQVLVHLRLVNRKRKVIHFSREMVFSFPISLQRCPELNLATIAAIANYSLDNSY